MDELVSNDLLNEVLNMSNEGFLIADKDGVIRNVNKAWLNLCADSVPNNLTIGSNVHEMDEYIVDHVTTRSVASCVLETKKPYSCVYSPMDKRVIWSNGKPIFDDDGNLTFIVVNVNDISEILKLRDQIEDFDTIRKLYNEFMRSHVLVAQNPVQADPKMQELYKKCLTISNTDVTVMLMGASGVGKEVVANFIHNHSQRKGKPFLSINCGAIPENLIESELFGYVPGAFTGANKGGKKGIFEAANTGTLLLDEIGEMPKDMQVKLLRVLETNTVTPIGSTKGIPFDVRIIVATNRNLKEMVKVGKFRSDLYYRINVINIFIPPLCERPDDIEALALYFLRIFNLQYYSNSNIKSLSPDLIQRMKSYSWPGNVRELRNIIEQMVILSKEDVIEQRFFDSIIQSNVQVESPSIVSVHQIAKLDDIIEESERQLFKMVAKTKKSTREIAKLLNVSQTTVVRKLRKYSDETSTDKG